MSRLQVYRESVLSLGYDFIKSRVLQTAFELDLFERLGTHSKTALTLAEEIIPPPVCRPEGPISPYGGKTGGGMKANLRSLGLFLNALVSLGLLAADGSGFRNTKYGLEIFLKSRPLYIGDIVGLQSRSARDWLGLKDAVLSGKPMDRPDFFKIDDSSATRGFAHAMHNTAIGHAEYLARKLSLKNAKTLLDLGGGPGTFTIHFLKANPKLEATIFDLSTTLETTKKIVETYRDTHTFSESSSLRGAPAASLCEAKRRGDEAIPSSEIASLPSVARNDAKRIRDASLEERVRFQAGDFNRDPIQGTFDICFLSHIIHGQGSEENQKLFSKIFEALNGGGKLIVQDFFLNPDKHSPQFAALFALNMLIHTDGGRTYTFEEVEDWMKESGFARTTRSRLNLPRSISILVGEKK